jgi:hypothetical protein
MMRIMAFRLERTNCSRASCTTFGIVAACAIVAAILIVTMPAPQGGGDFGGINTFVQAMAAWGLLQFGWFLSLLGSAFGVAGLFRQGEDRKAAKIGLTLNFLTAAAGMAWLLSH